MAGNANQVRYVLADKVFDDDLSAGKVHGCSSEVRASLGVCAASVNASGKLRRTETRGQVDRKLVEPRHSIRAAHAAHDHSGGGVSIGERFFNRKLLLEGVEETGSKAVACANRADNFHRAWLSLHGAIAGICDHAARAQFADQHFNAAV